MKTAKQWWEEWRLEGKTDVETLIRNAQNEAYHEGQLAGLQMGKETIEEVFGKPAERSESV